MISSNRPGHCLFTVSSLAAVILFLPLSLPAETVLITGANSGLGLEFTRQYTDRGWSVIATHRRTETPASLAAIQAEHSSLRVERMDVTHPEQVLALAEKLRGLPIDVIINNAGVYNDRSGCREEDCPGDWSTQEFGSLDFQLLDTIFSVNVKGPLQVSEAFVANVAQSRRKLIISISSTNGSLTQPLPGAGAIFYRASKAALNKSMQLVAIKLKDQGISVVMLHPGAVLTERQAYLSGYDGMIEMPFSVTHMIDTIDKLGLADTGRFIRYDGESLPW